MKEEFPKVLIVDDDGAAAISLVRALMIAGLGAECLAAGTPENALELCLSNDFSAAVVDLSLNAREGVESGFRLLRALGAYPNCRSIVLTGHGSVSHGIRALSEGAAHFLEKPADPHHLAALLRDSIAQSELRRAHAQMQLGGTRDLLGEFIIGKSPAIEKLRATLRFAAQTNQAVLITGETGTGKSLCASALHAVGNRAHARLVRYQPTFASADLVNSDLFGHVKGSFTGALEDRRGLVAEAHGGTLFLDEIDELPLETQVALLGVLQEKRFRPVGGNKEQEANFRLVCATNRPVERCLSEGKLRQDFFHRVSNLQIAIPPLRERREDILELAAKILARLREREGLNVFEIDAAAIALLTRFDWPGNVRQLEAVVEGGAYRANYDRSTVLLVKHIDLPSVSGDAAAGSFNEKVEAYKLKLVEEALTRSSGNQVRAADELKIDRSSLRRILARRQS